ncbi:hypothetical protein CONPUDRAFT_91182 [Coniophora puteana RWD-64-598 SS2]|uniref:3-beta hydroxysteroid dehydrogenase/isomerase domain-containing protein n=1 Tax=Coniophora puteana (strain RWD-64-598) TaxID=741705 RepID=A0A5M3MLL8_CONPW|nr:uncharacterized protein CONPUDRAFT_91182 [Coniophora puteana RWD-64-598 SS2]EIW79993.1 hypothetical protein CONPUDRAFT_91182 [Coniophora puteana RWD-64-598 SS2]
MITDSYLIVGGSGLLGQHIVEQLLDRGEENVAILDVSQPPSPNPVVPVYVGDITNVGDIVSAIEKSHATCVIHTASSLPGKPRHFQEQVNIIGTRNIVQAAISKGITKLVYTSTASVVFAGKDQHNVNETAPYANPHVDDYNETKAEAEKVVLEASGKGGLYTTSLRPAGLFGPKDRLTIPSMMGVAQSGRAHLQLGDNENLFDWTYIGNAAKAHLLAADRLSPNHPKFRLVAGQAFFITNGDPRPWWDFPRLLWKTGGYKIPEKTTVIPKYAAYAIATLMEFFCWALRRKPSLTRMTVIYCCTSRWCDISKARHALDYNPDVSIEEGAKISVEWWKREHQSPSTGGIS